MTPYPQKIEWKGLLWLRVCDLQSVTAEWACWSGPVHGSGSVWQWLLMSWLTKESRVARTVWALNSKATPTYPLPPGRLGFLRVPEPSQILPPAREQALKTKHEPLGDIADSSHVFRR